MNETFDREELQRLEGKAKAMADVTPNPNWKRAYNDLAHAACVLDAFIARTTVCEDTPLALRQEVKDAASDLGMIGE